MKLIVKRLLFYISCNNFSTNFTLYKISVIMIIILYYIIVRK